MNYIFAVSLLLQFLQPAVGKFVKRPVILPNPKPGVDCLCNYNDNPCKCELRIEHLLTMVYNDSGNIWLVEPCDGSLCLMGKENEGRQLTKLEQEKVITADGNVSRLVIGINGKFPGPLIDAYENQELEITVVNMLQTESITIHFHGLHQVGRPWMDGVAFITQCPILPGQTFVYRINASREGTYFYRSGIGNQRSMGLYGPVVVRKAEPEDQYYGEIIISLQDWNHDMDAGTAFQRMMSQQFDLKSGEPIDTTMSVDTANFSRFAFQSGLVNGKGRYWMTFDDNNGSPLERFVIRKGQKFRFRIIGAMTQYPMRVYIEEQTLVLRSSDRYNLYPLDVQSIIVQPGERYDFTFAFSMAVRKQYLLIAETIETRESHSGYHAAEAVFEIEDFKGPSIPNPPNSKIDMCSIDDICNIFNCPYNSSGTDVERCFNYNDVENRDTKRHPELVQLIDVEHFFNFGFPGPLSNSHGSVNGREFVYPVSSILTQPNTLNDRCTEFNCVESTCK